MRQYVNPCAAALIAGFCGTTSAFGQGVPPDYGYQWATIDRPGNRAATDDELRHESLRVDVGVVNHTYRIATTEVTAGDWLEFVRTYSRYYNGPAYNREFTGDFVEAVNQHPTRPEDWVLRGEGLERVPTNMGWRYAARYCNWLHNGKVDAACAFESGAYDTSTFTRNADGTYNDQAERSPGAKFWVPTRHEWEKALYYDPNRYGPGQDGYWFYPTSMDRPPISGFPWEGGETNAGDGAGTFPLMPVGSYTNVTSPWGLYDGSGGVHEWLEGWSRFGDRSIGGSDAGGFILSDSLPDLQTCPARVPRGGLRMASIPSPGTFTVVVLCFAPCFGRRRSSVCGQ